MACGSIEDFFTQLPKYFYWLPVLLPATCPARMKIFCLLLLICGVAAIAQAQQSGTPVTKRSYTTQHLENSHSIRLDGIPDEGAWNAAAWSEDFIQYQPTENTAPYQQTHFKIVYDSKYLYLAYEALDAAPDSIVRRMGRRDDFPGDWVEVNIDSHHDLRSAFSFTLSASGVRGDEAISNNGDNWDASWSPIWYAKTHIGTNGWTAEVKIPFSQLRYGNEREKVWGLQVQRLIFRKQERSTWQYIPQSAGVWVSGFGELHGLLDVPPQKQLEIAPYIVAQAEQYPRVEGNPFAGGSNSKLSGGLDGKVAVTSDLMLDFSINPDFGQVEADPSEVRIDGFQSYFEERRPFFVESRSIFDYRLTGSAAGGDYDQDLLFYSRRIGAAPHGYPALESGEYAKMPDLTNILGAAKFSGKTKSGWSIGVLESVTKAEYATIDQNGSRRDEMVEPATNYFVGRVQKDIHGGNTVLGGIFTCVNRDDDLGGLLRKAAYTGGLDFLHYWKKRSWYYRGKVVFSDVRGRPSAIYNTQTSFEHLFHRAGIREVALDSSRTSLTGSGGTFRIGKSGGRGGKWGQTLRMETGLTWRSPQLELNDIGFMLTADEINHFAWAGLRFQRPFSIFRSANINYNHWSRWDFGGQWLYLAFNTNALGTFKNYWSARLSLDWNPYEVSNNALRGASALRKPAGGGISGYINTDSRKKLTANLSMNYGFGVRHTVGYEEYTLSLNAQPVNALSLGLSVGYSKSFRRQDQFVEQVVYNNALRTIVGSVDQQSLRFTLRATYNITPDLTIQYYGQPFITRPLYGSYGYVVDPLNADYDARFHKWTAEELRYADGVYEVDENHDGVADYRFYKPDFNFVQFRSNLVIRWEYRAGSELYLVWSQGNTPDVAGDLASPLQRSLFDNLFNGEARNIALLKFTYRLLR
jgi:hypothetical protein